MGDCDELLLVFVENQSPVANYTKSGFIANPTRKGKPPWFQR